MKFIDQDIEVIDSINGDRILFKIEYCGRVCYKSEDNIEEGSSKRFVKMLINHGHESVLEHVNITVKATTDRGISHELVRHRIASYSQESTRYCNYASGRFKGQLSVILSDSLKYNDVVKNYLIMGEQIYNSLILDCGIKPEDARDILPTCLKTEIVMTYNLREWRHVLKLRSDKTAHPKVRQLMKMILNVFKRTIPVVFDDIEPNE